MSDQHHVRTLKSFQADFSDGNNQALLDAVAYCAHHKLILPGWAAMSFNECWMDWCSLGSKSLGESFGISDHGDVRRDRNELLFRFSAWHLVSELIASGQAKDDSLFEEVAERLTTESGTKIGKTKVSEFFYDVEREREESSSVFSAMEAISRKLGQP